MIEAFKLFGEISLRGGEAVERGLKDVSNQAETTTKDMGGVGRAVVGVGSAMAGTQMLQGFASFGEQVLQATGDIQALDSQYEQVVGNMKKQTDGFIEAGAKAWGKHPNQLKSAMMQYMAILKGKGMSEEEAFDTASKYLSATVDANAFANEDMSATTDRFMGALKGEYESLDTAMVNLSQTMLNDIATEKYGKKFNELTIQQQEAIKTQEFLRQHTSAGVFGQGEREADSYANKTALLTEKWKEFQATLGAPIIEAVAGVLGKMSEGLGKIMKWFNKLNPDTRQMIVVVGLLSFGLTAIGLVIAGLVIGLGAFATAIGVSMGAVVLATGGIILLIPLIIGLIYLLIKNWDKIKAKTIEVWNAIWEKIKAFGNWLLNNTAIGLFVKTIIKNWDTIKKTTKILWNMVKALFQVGVNYIKQRLGPLVNFVQAVFNKVKNAMESPIKKAKETLMRVITAIKNAFNKLVIKIPKPKIPKISVTQGNKKIAGVNVPYPKFDIKWNKKGGYFNSPTLFGAGESGKEVLMPIENKRYMQPFSSAVAENLRDIFSPLIRREAVGVDTGNFNLVIPLNVNGREIARAIVPNIDQELKRQKDIKRRGV
jgi:hypothetical protein